MDPHLLRYPANIRKLCAISLARLPKMIDPATGLVVFSLVGPEHRPVGTSLRYTAMTALGLERAEDNGLASTVDRARLYEAMDATIAGSDDVGDLGLVLWATARHARPVAERALRYLLEFDGFVKRRGGRMVHSTELAWAVTGLAEALALGLGREDEVRARLDAGVRRLHEHIGPAGLVGFARPRAGAPLTPSERMRAELGFFDAQVYAILALLRRDELLGDLRARQAAAGIARQILRNQRPLGQWAWHYNTRTGATVDLYPVYSVHQDGMAPMALLPVEKRLGISTTPAIARGVDWLFGNNELGELMAIEDTAVIWRSIRRKEPLRSMVYALKVASLAGLPERLDLGGKLNEPGALEVDREFRPYHLGWCLYAFAELAGARRDVEPRSRRGERVTSPAAKAAAVMSATAAFSAASDPTLEAAPPSLAEGAPGVTAAVALDGLPPAPSAKARASNSA